MWHTLLGIGAGRQRCDTVRNDGVRYGYMEEVKQDDAFVRVLLERVLHLLYITLQERASAMPTLHHDLGLPNKVPVRAHSASIDSI